MARGLMRVIYDWPRWVSLVTILIISLAATELGFRRGRAQQVTESERDILTTIRTSTLGLVALLLGFSFAITSSRFNERSRLVMDEANAIGTCYLRAGLLADPASGEIRAALRRYTDLRIESFERGLDQREFERLADTMHAALDELWSGHALGEGGRRRGVLSLGINLLIIMVVFVVLDFDRPRRGMILVDQTPLIQLRETIRAP